MDTAAIGEGRSSTDSGKSFSRPPVGDNEDEALDSQRATTAVPARSCGDPCLQIDSAEICGLGPCFFFRLTQSFRERGHPTIAG